MISFQIVSEYLPGGESLKRQKPGVTRGDLVLSEGDLPMELAGWNRTHFVPAPAPESLPDGQYWWVHQWQYKRSDVRAIVAFDQLGEDHWHELTICYHILGWEIADRLIKTDVTSGGKYVVARMSKEDGQHGLLVFSVFFQDGQWDSPPDVQLSFVNAWDEEEELALRMADRFGQSKAPMAASAKSPAGPQRALQCQVFITTNEPISDSHTTAAVELHLQSRNHFRSHWLQRAQPDPLTAN